MIKRDSIQKINFIPVEDEQGGNSIDKQYGETIKAMVSQNTTYGQMTQYGVKEEIILNVVVDNKLETSTTTRYIWNNKIFKVMRQVKSGNEWFVVLMEVNE